MKPAVADCSSKKRSSGALNAPCTQIIAIPNMREEISTDPTSVKNIITILRTDRIPRISLSLNLLPYNTRGSVRKKYRKDQPPNKTRSKKSETRCESRLKATTEQSIIT